MQSWLASNSSSYPGLASLSVLSRQEGNTACIPLIAQTLDRKLIYVMTGNCGKMVVTMGNIYIYKPTITHAAVQPKALTVPS